MPGSSTTARVYSETLLQVAQETNALDHVAGEVAVLRAALREAPRLREFLDSPRIEQEQKKGALRAALGDRLSSQTLRFLELVIERDRQALLDDILAEFESRVGELRNQQVVEVASARPLADSLKSRLRDTFARATGREIVLRERVDPSLLGGIVVQLGDTRIDGSARARLERLRERMLTAARASNGAGPTPASAG